MKLSAVFFRVAQWFGLILFATSATAQNTLPNNATFDEIIERGRLDIAVYEDFPPFSYRENGKLVGIDVDIGRRIAEKLGVSVRFREQTAGEKVDDDLRNAIWKGHYLGGGVMDILMHVPHDREFARRNNMVVITGPYYEEQLVLARDTRKTGDTASLAVYRFEKIGVELDTLPDFYLSAFQGGMLAHNIVHFRTVEQATEALLNEEIAAVFASRSQIQAGLGALPEHIEMDSIYSQGLQKPKWDLGVAVSHKSRQLGYEVADILLELVESGEIETLFKQYGLTYHRPAYLN